MRRNYGTLRRLLDAAEPKTRQRARGLSVGRLEMLTYLENAAEILNDVQKILSPSGTRWYEAHFAFVKVNVSEGAF